jgi:hypothetical protein
LSRYNSAAAFNTIITPPPCPFGPRTQKQMGKPRQPPNPLSNEAAPTSSNVGVNWRPQPTHWRERRLRRSGNTDCAQAEHSASLAIVSQSRRQCDGKAINLFGMALNTRSLKSGKHSYILKQLWLSVNADGLLGGFTAVSAKLKLDPTIISAGIKFRFD